MSGVTRPRRWLIASIVLGLTPLVTGVGIFLLWLLVRWDLLMLAGVFTIYGGLLCVGGGFACLVKYWFVAGRGGVNHLAWRILAVALLQLANFPVAVGVVVAAHYVHTRFTVEVTNESGEPIRQMVVSGGGVKAIIEDVPAGERRTESFHFTQDGSLGYEFTHQGKIRSGVVEGYVTNGQGGRRSVLIHQDGTVFVR